MLSGITLFFQMKTCQMKKGGSEGVNYKKLIFSLFGTTATTMKILKHCLNY